MLWSNDYYGKLLSLPFAPDDVIGGDQTGRLRVRMEVCCRHAAPDFLITFQSQDFNLIGKGISPCWIPCPPLLPLLLLLLLQPLLLPPPPPLLLLLLLLLHLLHRFLLMKVSILAPVSILSFHSMKFDLWSWTPVFPGVVSRSENISDWLLGRV